MMSSVRWFRLAVVSLAALLITVPADAQRKKPRLQPKRKRLMPNQKSQGGARPVGRLAGFSNWVTAVAVSPDGKSILVGTHSEVRIYELKSRKLKKTLKTKPGYVRALVFSPRGDRLAVGGYEGLYLYDAKSYAKPLLLDGHTGQVTAVAFSPDGKQVVSSSLDETVRLWNAKTGKEIKKIGDFEYPVNGVAFSPDGRWIATASGDEYRVTRPGIVKIWDAKTGKEKTWITKDAKGTPKIVQLVEHEKAATSVRFSPSGKLLISTGFDEKVNVYDVATGKALGYFDGHGRPTHQTALIGENIVASAAGGRAKKRYLGIVWNRIDGEALAELKGHRATVCCIAASPDGKTIITGSHDKTAIVWDLSPSMAKIKKSLREYPVEAPRPARKAVGQAVPDANTKPRVTFTDVRHSLTYADAPDKTLRVGIIGLDTSHAPAFARLFNVTKPSQVKGFRVVAAYPKGSPDIQSSVVRVPKYTKALQGMGVEIVDSIPELIKRVDFVLLETNDGRPHLEQVLPVLKAGKPVFIDKPIAGSLADAVAIFQAAKKYKTPVFSSSSLRYGKGTQAVRAGKIGKVKSATTHSPCSLEKTHPDLFWYGIHGVESLFTVMGTGCVSVRRTVHNKVMDEVVGVWKDGRKGTFQGYRKGGAKRGYGGKAIGEKGEMNIGKYNKYDPLVYDIVKFFRAKKSPVPERETLEIYAFMEAADESKRRGGEAVKIEDVLTKARAKAKKRLAALDK